MIEFPRALALALLCSGPAGAQIHFQNVAPATGTTDKSLGRGSAWVDLDGDGLLDLVNANADQALSFFRQKPNHTFEPATGPWSIPQDTYQHWVPLVADYDNDGDPDIYVASGGRATLDPNQLLRNDIDPLTHQGALVDVTAAAGAAGFVGLSHGASALDYDLDGRVDIFVSAASGFGCTLLHNDGGLVFSDSSAAAGVDAPGNHRACGAGDIDNDGWPDIGVSGFTTANRLFHNQRDGTFVDIAQAAGVDNPSERSFGMVFADYDNDGWLDLFVPTLNPLSVPGAPTRVYLNQGNLTFSVGADLGSHQSMGHNSTDLDADGYPDLYIGTGNPSTKNLDLLFRNTSSGPGQLGFVDISLASGIQAMGETRCHGLAFGDYDGDGDLDVYANNGGPKFPKDEQGLLWRSGGNANGWLGVDLEGVLSNRSAIGARAVARTSSGREVHRLRSAGKGFGNSDAPTLHFGLGPDAAVERVEVAWPSGIIQLLLEPATHQRHSLVETGLRLAQPAVAVGAAATLELCGRARFAAEVLVAGATGMQVPVPELGGAIELLPPHYWLGSVALDASGLATLSLAIPGNPVFAGQTLYLQAWIHAPGTLADSVLTNAVALQVL